MIKTFIGCLCLLSLNLVYAKKQFPVEFFASNNTQEISLETAYDRLTGLAQSELENSMIALMQKNHVEQGKFEDILGTYRMSNNQQITADNTEHFSASPYQKLAKNKIFSLAQQLAITLKQDSVAVLMPDQSVVGGITVHFISHQPSINEVVEILRDKLPESYSHAFSLHLNHQCKDFSHATVTEVAWLGSRLSADEIRAIFPLETINHYYGKVYLVYHNGKTQRL